MTLGLPPPLPPLLLGRPLAALVCEHCDPLDDSLPGRRHSSSASLALLLLMRREPTPSPTPRAAEVVSELPGPGGVPELGVAGVAGVGGGVTVDEGVLALPSLRALGALLAAPAPAPSP